MKNVSKKKTKGESLIKEDTLAEKSDKVKQVCKRRSILTWSYSNEKKKWSKQEANEEGKVLLMGLFQRGEQPSFGQVEEVGKPKLIDQ